MNFKLLAWIVLPIAGLVAAGVVVSWLIGWAFSLVSSVLAIVFYLVLGAAAVGVIMWGWSRLRGKVSRAPHRKELP